MLEMTATQAQLFWSFENKRGETHATNIDEDFRNSCFSVWPVHDSLRIKFDSCGRSGATAATAVSSQQVCRTGYGDNRGAWRHPVVAGTAAAPVDPLGWAGRVERWRDTLVGNSLSVSSVSAFVPG